MPSTKSSNEGTAWCGRGKEKVIIKGYRQIKKNHRSLQTHRRIEAVTARKQERRIRSGSKLTPLKIIGNTAICSAEKKLKERDCRFTCRKSQSSAIWNLGSPASVTVRTIDENTRSAETREHGVSQSEKRRTRGRGEYIISAGNTKNIKETSRFFSRRGYQGSASRHRKCLSQGCAFRLERGEIKGLLGGGKQASRVARLGGLEKEDMRMRCTKKED